MFNTSEKAGKNLHVVSHLLRARKRHPKAPKHPGLGAGVLPYRRLTGMCRWTGLHFHDWIDYEGVAFSIV